MTCPYEGMLQAEPEQETLPNEIPVVDEITEESCPDMYHELTCGRGTDEEECECGGDGDE